MTALLVNAFALLASLGVWLRKPASRFRLAAKALMVAVDARLLSLEPTGVH